MSETTLDQLIKSLKEEAIDAAELEAKNILEAARLKAKSMLKNAEQEKAQILEAAEQQAQSIVNNGKSALRQAARDHSITVKNDLLKVFQKILEKETQKAFTPDLVKTAILRIVENIEKEVTLKLPSDLSQELAEFIQNQLQTTDQLISVKEDAHLLEGFVISKSSQGWNYTISPETLSETLNQQLSSNWAAMLKEETE